MRPLRILYLITRGEPGGAQVHVLELLRGFRDRFQIALGLGEGGFLAEEAVRLGVPVRVLPNLMNAPHPWRDARALREILALMREFRPDLVHCHSSKAGFLGRLAARRLGIPAVFTAHGWAFSPGAPPARRALALAAEGVAARWTARIITVSDFDRRLALCHGVAPAEKVVAVRNGISDSLHRACPGIEAARPVREPPPGVVGLRKALAPGGGTGGGPRVVMVARFAPPKEHALVLRAAALVHGPASAGKGPLQTFRLVFVGDGPLRPVAERLARELGLSERVEFLGGRTDVAEILAGCHAFVLASRYEGLPLTVLEAMRAGLPVVATDVGGMAEAVRDGETGFLVASPARNPARTVAELADCLSRLFAGPELRARLGTAARRLYEHRFQVAPMLRSLEEVYHEVLAKANGGGGRERGGWFLGAVRDCGEVHAGATAARQASTNSIECAL